MGSAGPVSPRWDLRVVPDQVLKLFSVCPTRPRAHDRPQGPVWLCFAAPAVTSPAGPLSVLSL